MNNETFRFMVFRSPEKRAKDEVISGQFDSAFTSTVQAQRAKADRQGMIDEASAFMNSPEFVGDIAALPLPLIALADVLVKQPDIAARGLRSTVETIFKVSIEELTASAQYRAVRERVRDSILAVRIAGAPPRSDLPSRLARAYKLLDLVASPHVDARLTQAQLSERLGRTIVLPDGIFPLPPYAVGRAAKASSARSTLASPSVAPLPPPEELHAALHELSDWRTLDFEPVKPVERKLQHRVTRSKAGALQTVSGTMTPTAPMDPVWRLSRRAVEALSPQTRAVAGRLRVDFDEASLPEVVGILRRALERSLTEQPPRRHHAQMVRFAGGAGPVSGIGTAPGPGGGAQAQLGNAVPVEPAGVAELIVVRQSILKYELGEVAHIENALRGEYRSRRHRRTDRTETVFTVQTETSEETERDLETAEKFELERESENTIKEESKLEAGLKVTASYGPWISTEANTAYGNERSSERSERVASSYSRSVTEKAVAKIQKKVKEEKTVRVVAETEELNEHTIDNTGSGQHVSGVYRWVDKLYRMRTLRYGKRLMFDFVVPEPAAFFMDALLKQLPDGVTFDRPEPFVLTASQVTEVNYRDLAARYAVTGLEPPPMEMVTIAHTVKGEMAPPNSGLALTAAGARLTVPQGYYAYALAARTNWAFEPADELHQTIVSSGRIKFHSSLYNPDLANPANTVDWEQTNVMRLWGVSEVPVAVTATHWSPFVVSIEVLCVRTDEAYEAWQLKTHDEILKGYLAAKSRYDEQVAASRVTEGISISGRNPGQNRVLERNELKKAAISLLTQQHYEGVDAMEVSNPEGYPQLNIALAPLIGSVVKFFEQAFEWPEMTYLFYPYFWGRKSRWQELILLEDNDPIHAEFLRAGAARVVVPVRPGFEPAILHYLETGQIWQGTDPPSVASPLYIDIAEEIRFQTAGAPGATEFGDPWEVRLPTPMVLLQPDAVLPDWGP